MARRTLAILCAGICPIVLAAQSNDNPCGENCIAPARIVVTEAGEFAGATAISPEKQADEFAALEQQRWREFRYDVLQDATFSSALTIVDINLPDNFPPSESGAMVPVTISMHASIDGEHYRPIDNNSLVARDSLISILVSQATIEGTDGRVSFAPSEWRFEVSAQVVSGLSSTSLYEVLKDAEGERPLGCHIKGCGEQAASVTSSTVAGITALDSSGELPGAPEARSAPLKADETALELQTELARVGCYSGALDGLWGPASRKAMSAFNRANKTDVPVQSATPRALVTVARATDVVCASE